MEFRDNADVLDGNGNRIGSIDRVVIDPQSRTVTHLVAKKGHLFTSEKVIPVELVQPLGEDRVILNDVDHPDELADFEETYHVSAEGLLNDQDDRSGYARPVMWYPQPGIPSWGMGTYPMYPAPQVFVRTRRNIPEGAVPLEEGAQVVCRDGEKAGRVARIFSVPEDRRVTHMVISSGLIHKVQRLIPSVWIEQIQEDRVHLNVACDVIHGLPLFSA